MSGTRGTRDTNGTHGTPDTGAPGPLVEVEDLQIELITDRGVVRAVDGVGFTIDPGETVTMPSASPAPASPPPRWACCGCCPTGSPSSPGRPGSSVPTSSPTPRRPGGSAAGSSPRSPRTR
ncbi:hypothetical protein SANTM175S_08361 [Streptomyces antimycoticus]